MTNIHLTDRELMSLVWLVELRISELEPFVDVYVGEDDLQQLIRLLARLKEKTKQPG